ncbi:MAG: hypothetical protein AUK54_09100 [Helicobacteraceae bacterium CG2_30_36_10]|nr:MAG: hypothetical protein AUK54_09100 [Helicobacteraceae bacterium CG2_30_36_10]
MLKVLFSPSEGKQSGGNESAKELLGSNIAREKILNEYNNLIKNSSEKEICNLFGFKKQSECQPYINDIFSSPLMAAIERYQGVAYNYLEFSSLQKKAQEYLKANTIIFSNLYGPILGGDTIANYKVKQGNDIGNFIPEKFYKERFTYQLDLYLNNDEILDLRAGYYDKFYKITKPYTTLKFLKEGKSVSHWAKAYRGIVLREVAKNDINSLDEFMSLEIEGLSAQEIKVTKNKKEIIYNIV